MKVSAIVCLLGVLSLAQSARADRRVVDLPTTCYSGRDAEEVCWDDADSFRRSSGGGAIFHATCKLAMHTMNYSGCSNGNDYAMIKWMEIYN